jgi:tetratricopeptide (TPR) repeat protein
VRRCRNPGAREVDAVHRRAEEAMGAREFSTAVTLLEQIIAKDPLRASAWAQLGAVYTEMKRYAEATKTLRHLGEFAPDNVQVWGLLGAALEASGDRAEAEKAFRRNVQVDPEDWKSRRKLAQFLMRQGRVAEAVPEFEKAAQLAPPTGPQLYEMGEARLRAGDVTGATADLQAAVKVTGDAQMMNDAAYLLVDANARLDIAAAWAESAVRLHASRLLQTPLDAVGAAALDDTDALLLAWDTLGWARFRQGRLAEAERYVAAAQAAQTAAGLEGWPKAAYHLGQVLERAGRRDDAILAYARALTVDSPPDKVRDRLAALVGEGRVAAAVADARRRGRAVIRIPAPESTGEIHVLVVLGSSGSVLTVSPSSATPLPTAAERLRGIAHEVPFPDPKTDKLVVTAAFRCGDGVCTAELGAPTVGPPSKAPATNLIPSVDAEPR